MNFLKIFHRKKSEAKKPPQPLCIEGCTTHLTPEPDDAELAAQALLESLADNSKVKGLRFTVKNFRKRKHTRHGNHEPLTMNQEPQRNDAAYYHQLADRICKTHAQEARRAKRYVAYCEQELNNHRDKVTDSSENHESVLVILEQGLYKHLDTVKREGGELKRRWQHCLAEVIVCQSKEGI